MLKKSTFLFFLGVLCLPICIFAQSKIIYVNTAAIGKNDGSSWQNAYKDLQDALQIAKKTDAIWIAKGTYFPTKTNDRTISYDMKNGVSIYGGFEGNEISAAKRDFEKNKTILSGNIGSTADSLDNSYRLVNAIDIQDVTYLDGVEIAYGYANYTFGTPPFEKGVSGAGLYIGTTKASILHNLKVINCKFYNHFANTYGGAIYYEVPFVAEIAIYLKKCSFYQNTSKYGGAIMITENTPLGVEIDSCSFVNNYGDFQGGAIYTSLYAGKDNTWNISNSKFSQNRCKEGEGYDIKVNTNFTSSKHTNTFVVSKCIFEKGKKGIGLSTSSISIYESSSKVVIYLNSCIFQKQMGVCILTTNALYLDNCIFQNNQGCFDGRIKRMNNNVFYNNAGVGYAPNNKNNDYSNNLFLRNKDLFRNYKSITDSTIFSNCIFWENKIDPFFLSSFRLQNSIVDSTMLKNPNGKNIVYDKNCLFNVNPLFADTSKFDFHILPCSPAINAGNNAYATDLLTDLDGKPRIAHKKIDIGPYEFQDFKINTYTTKPTFCTSKQGNFLPTLKGNCSNLPTITWENTQKQTGSGGEKLSAGVYTFFVKDTNGCADTLKNITIEDKGIISADFNIFNTSGTNAKNGSITVKNVNNGKAPFKYIWSSGDTTKTTEYLKAGDYKVTISDANGCVFSTTLTVSAASATSDIFIQNISATPNPASEKITFSYDVSQFEKELFVTFYDLQGKVILAKQKIKNKEEIDISNLAKGLYFGQITDNQYFTKINKIIIQ